MAGTSPLVLFLINHGAVSLPVFVVVVAHNPLIALHAEAEEEAREQEEETAKNPSPVVIVIDDGRTSVCVFGTPVQCLPLISLVCALELDCHFVSVHLSLVSPTHSA